MKCYLKCFIQYVVNNCIFLFMQIINKILDFKNYQKDFIYANYQNISKR